MEDLDSFYDYYNRELTYLRRQGSQFARQYPQVAQQLDLSAQTSSDPHVERLLESFAYLTARLQRDIDDQFPRLTQALLGLLYPQFVDPLPSLSIAEFKLSPDKGKLSALHKVLKGTTLFTTLKTEETCRFQTCYDVMLGPHRLISAAVISPLADPLLSSKMMCPRALKLHLQSFGTGFQQLNLKSLRFYIEGSPLLKESIYEGLFSQNDDRCPLLVSVGSLENSQDLYSLPATSIRPVGFEDRDSILPYTSLGHPGYRLMFEYFQFPEKFYFFDVQNLRFSQDSKDLVLVLPLADTFSYKNSEITARNFRLHCTPIINLFKKTSEPLHLDHRCHEYRLVSSLHQEATTEIHSLIDVKATVEGDRNVQVFRPYFSYHTDDTAQDIFWTHRRTPAVNSDFLGTDIFLTFVDPHLNPALPSAKTVFAQTLCTNRWLATEIAVGTLLSPEQENPASEIVCLYKPTAPFYPLTEGAHPWQLISHLSLNHLSLSHQSDGLRALKQIIQLYQDPKTNDSTWIFDAIQNVETTSVLRRFGQEAWRGFLPGTQIQLTVDLQQNTQKKLFLFASVLNQFCAQFAAVNSFTELSLFDQNRQGVWKTWSPQVGTQVLL